MKSYKITDIKNFMNKLLLLESFDAFFLSEGTIITGTTFLIDGHVQKDFYTKEEQEASIACSCGFSPWKEMRPICFQLIKGKRTPLSFKLVLLLQPQDTDAVTGESVSAGDLNLIRFFTLMIRYETGEAVITTGLSTTTFLMDREPEKTWDHAVRHFLDRAEIAWEMIEN